ncbi:putative ubiquitin-activating enzyme [Helianthus anomalus]
MGFCDGFRTFSGFLLRMLPKKRHVEVVMFDDDDSSDDCTDRLRKRRQISWLTYFCELIICRTNTVGTVGKKGSGGEEFNSSAIGMGLEDANMQDIDEDLYSRQFTVYGRETMRRLFASNVLLYGMQGLGAEIDFSIAASSSVLVYEVEDDCERVRWWCFSSGVR